MVRFLFPKQFGVASGSALLLLASAVWSAENVISTSQCGGYETKRCECYERYECEDDGDCHCHAFEDCRSNCPMPPEERDGGIGSNVFKARE